LGNAVGGIAAGELAGIVPLLALMVFVYLRNQSLALRIRDPGRKLWRKSVSGLHHSCPGG